MDFDTDVVIIGAGPSGTSAAAFLRQKGWRVEIVERVHFPRFSIGESLLAQSIAILDDAGLMPWVEKGGFQYKDGAAFQIGDKYEAIDFHNKISAGPAATIQVRRDRFDQLLAEGAADMGAKIHFGQEVIAFASDEESATVTLRDEAGAERMIRARFALDASGFGRVLSRLLDLEVPSNFPPRRGLFCHVKDNIDDPTFDRNKILVSVNPDDHSIWYWLIPQAEGISSIGVVGEDKAILSGDADETEKLWQLIGRAERMADVLRNAEQVRPTGTIHGYACSVKSLVGPSYALLGNAAEFLDPVFSSGVTIALKSAQLATALIDRKLRGEAVDWQRDFVDELYVGIETFRACVAAWYDESLQTIIFNNPGPHSAVTKQITSILAGYAWDRANPIVREPVRYLKAVAELCASPA